MPAGVAGSVTSRTAWYESNRPHRPDAPRRRYRHVRVQRPPPPPPHVERTLRCAFEEPIGASAAASTAPSPSRFTCAAPTMTKSQSPLPLGEAWSSGKQPSDRLHRQDEAQGLREAHEPMGDIELGRALV